MVVLVFQELFDVCTEVREEDDLNLSRQPSHELRFDKTQDIVLGDAMQRCDYN